MSLNEFKNMITVLTGNEAYNIRNMYIESFIDSGKEHYKKYIQTLRNYSDGMCYTGYLWDCLKNPIAIDFSYLESRVINLNEIFVFWDIHSKERILIQDYWKFGKDNVLKLTFNELLHNLEFIPEDVYIFDNSFKWTLILTHEYIDDKKWCLKSGEI